MKIFSASQIRAWDAYTIEQEPVLSVDLMERAALKCTEWLIHNHHAKQPLHIFCGKGNNGGDGLAIARLLIQKGCKVSVYILEFGHKGTDDFQVNLHRLHQVTTSIHFLQTAEAFPLLTADDTVIDAMFGTGLNKAPDGITADLINHINHSPATVISIDIPTGMITDKSCKDATVIHAQYTLCFQVYKECFLMPENEEACGEVHLLNIGLHPDYYKNTIAAAQLIDQEIIQQIYHKRKAFSHKGHFGHALLVAGSFGKIGAAVLSAEACLRSGVGLVTVHAPSCGVEILQTSVPEAMVDADTELHIITSLPKDLIRYAAIGIGPGIGLHETTADLLMQLLHKTHQPMVIDADALNLLSIKKNLATHLHEDCILTPHPKEFERLFGTTANDFERKELAMKKAEELNCVIILKGHHTFIGCANGNAWFNSTGNSGMATAGSGDVLTGILTGLLAQGYSAEEAALLGVYLHGLAGDIAAAHLSQEAMIAGDISKHLGKAFLQISQTN
ncbi:MAG: NAD(P)H-hydrate dehydratase [Chitinophagaceae bacterium]|nr:NAD(P)H-hydrate dehydratase [Chitinophagaceae bacterium]